MAVYTSTFATMRKQDIYKSTYAIMRKQDIYTLTFATMRKQDISNSTYATIRKQDISNSTYATIRKQDISNHTYRCVNNMRFFKNYYLSSAFDFSIPSIQKIFSSKVPKILGDRDIYQKYMSIKLAISVFWCYNNCKA
ncbi:MAG: hypothetical protein ACI4MY_00205 [Christensenellales bacterium]